MARPKLSDAERDALREEKRATAEAAIDRLLCEDGWATWLRLRRSLHTYSWTNQVLIAQGAWSQSIMAAEGHPAAPATPCAERPSLVKAAWRWKLDGYHPAKGTRALYVWVYKGRRRKDGGWTCCGEPRGKLRQCPVCGKADHFFQLGPVFDASQVVSFDTGERPETPNLEGEPITGSDPGGALLAPLAEWAIAEGIVATVDLDAESEHGEGGSWNTRTRHLRVCSGEPNRQLRTLVHELAHALGITSKDAPELTYADAEVAVECVSFIVAGVAGLDTSGEAVPYMAGWGGEDARAKVRALASLIDATAKRLEAPVVALLAGDVDRQLVTA